MTMTGLYHLTVHDDEEEEMDLKHRIELTTRDTTAIFTDGKD